MRFRKILTYSLLVLAPVALFWGCGKMTTPVAPASNSTVQVTVPLVDVHGRAFSSTQVKVLYYFSGNSGQPVTGSAGTVSVSTGSSFTFTQANNSYNYVAVQLNDASSNQVIAIGAAILSGSGTFPVTLGPVNKAVYQVTLGAGQAFGFESDANVPVGVQPTPTPGSGLDIFCNTTSTGFELDNVGLSSKTVAYLGNAAFVNFLKIPGSGLFQTTSTASKAIQTSSTDVAPGDIFCVKMNGGGYAWLQAQSVTNAGVSFVYRVNTTLPFCGYEQTTADLAAGNSTTPTATATALSAPVSVVSTFSLPGSSLGDVAVWGPTSGAATTIFASDSVNGIVYAYSAANTSTALYQVGGLNNPVGLAVDPNEPYLYVANSGASVVDQYQIGANSFTLNGVVGDGAVTVSPDTTVQANAGELVSPRYLTLDNNGDLFVTDTGTPNLAGVMEFIGSTIPLGTIPNVNYWNGSLSNSSSNSIGQIAAAGTTMVVADSANSCIRFYSASGTSLATALTSDNNPAGQVNFIHPQGVAWSISTNNLYISDTGNNRVVEMSLTGSFVKILPSSLGLSGPTGIKLDNAQPPYIYVADTGNNRVLKLQ